MNIIEQFEKDTDVMLEALKGGVDLNGREEELAKKEIEADEKTHEVRGEPTYNGLIPDDYIDMSGADGEDDR